MQQIRKPFAIFLMLTAFSYVSLGQSKSAQSSGPQTAGAQKSNILFMMGDDIGWMRPSIYHRGLMAHRPAALAQGT